MRFGTIGALAFTCAGLVLASCQGAGGQPEPEKVAAVDQKRLENADADPANWLSNGRGYREDHYSPLDQINTGTIGKLSLAWFYDLDTDRGQEATPLVADGVMYTSTAWSKVVALDAKTGRLIWAYDPKVKGEKAFDACCDVVNRGVALWNGKVYVGALDGRLIALDAATGKVDWEVQTTDTTRPYTITGAPRVVRGKVIIGNGGAELGVRGYVSAYDAENGKLVWRFYTAPNPQGKPDGAPSDAVFAKFAGKTWGPNGQWKNVGGGGTVWDSIVYDQDLNQLIVGTGNGSPWNRRVRSGDDGDNLFLSTLLALDPDTGAYKWHYQETPGEEWDFTATQTIILADMAVGGQPRKVLFHAPKNGFFFVIDRATGKPISAQNFTPQNWSDGYDTTTWRPKIRPEARYSENGGTFVATTSGFGAHSWHPMSYSPKTGLVYIPAQMTPFGYTDDKNYRYAPGLWNIGITLPEGGPTEAQITAMKAMVTGTLIAWDPVTQKQRFAVRHASTGNGGVLSTAGNLVFQGTPEGDLFAYDATNGKQLWQFAAQSGIIAAPMSFAIGKEQYIAVMVGFGGAFGLSSPFAPDPHKRPNGRVLVFKIGGTAALPPYIRPVMPAQVPDEKFLPQQTARGASLFMGFCGACHGPAAVSSGVLPDLRRSGVVMDKDTFHQVVLGGMLKDRGMISFAKWLKPEDADAIRAYIAAQAALLKRKEQAESPRSKP